MHYLDIVSNGEACIAGIQPTWLCYILPLQKCTIWFASNLFRAVVYCYFSVLIQFGIGVMIAWENKLGASHLFQCSEAVCLIRGLSVS